MSIFVKNPNSMKIEIELRDRLFNDITSFCKMSLLDINKTLIQWIEDRFYTEKYGDLNKIFGLDDEIKKEEEKSTEIKKKTPKRQTTKKIEKIQPDIIEIVPIEKDENTIVKEECIENTKKVTKRTLKSK